MNSDKRQLIRGKVQSPELGPKPVSTGSCAKSDGAICGCYHVTVINYTRNTTATIKRLDDGSIEVLIQNRC